MKAIVLNCTLKPSPQESNTEALANTVISALERQGVEVDTIRIVDHVIKPGVESDMGEGDAWPTIRQRLLGAEILILATPTWLGHMSSVAQAVLERMDGMISEKTPEGLPVAYNRVAGVVVTGNEDGAHHVIATVAQGLIDVGYTVPGQAWTYWNMGPGPGPSYSETDHKHQWSKTTGETCAQNLYSVATALGMNPLQKPVA